MNKNALKKALPAGIGSAVLCWVFLSLFELLIDGKPMSETLFSTYGLVFLVVMIPLETYLYYRKFAKKQER